MSQMTNCEVYLKTANFKYYIKIEFVGEALLRSRSAGKSLCYYKGH